MQFERRHNSNCVSFALLPFVHLCLHHADLSLMACLVYMICNTVRLSNRSHIGQMVISCCSKLNFCWKDNGDEKLKCNEQATRFHHYHCLCGAASCNLVPRCTVCSNACNGLAATGTLNALQKKEWSFFALPFIHFKQSALAAIHPSWTQSAVVYCFAFLKYMSAPSNSLASFHLCTENM